MPIDTQISSFTIPREVWKNGYDGAPDLPPLHLAARDAIAIERRAIKRVNLRNEQRRYTLCCERIQGIVQELSRELSVLPNPLVWPSQSNPKIPIARAYLAVMAFMGRWMSRFLKSLPAEQLKSIYPRVSAVFFPPEDAARHLECFDLIANHPQVHLLFERAAGDATLAEGSSDVSATQCQQAFYMRHELLKAVAAKGQGLVDVLELV